MSNHWVKNWPSRARQALVCTGSHWLPRKSAACEARLSQFFTQWFDTAYPGGGGVNKPAITGPGLAGAGFYDASGGCSA